MEEKQMRVRRNNERPRHVHRGRERRRNQGFIWVRRIERVKDNLSSIFKDDELSNSLDNVIKRLNELTDVKDSETK